LRSSATVSQNEARGLVKMLFECQNPECNEKFHHAAKQVLNQFTTLKATDDLPAEVVLTESVEHYVCPFCKELTFTEFIEPTPAPEEVANVYVYELTSGAQTALDALLAQGYVIVNRYSKQYHLEKPKLIERKTWVLDGSNTDMSDAKVDF
jgi:hypothetical protein